MVLLHKTTLAVTGLMLVKLVTFDSIMVLEIVEFIQTQDTHIGHLQTKVLGNGKGQLMHHRGLILEVHLLCVPPLTPPNKQTLMLP